MFVDSPCTGFVWDSHGLCPKLTNQEVGNPINLLFDGPIAECVIVVVVKLLCSRQSLPSRIILAAQVTVMPSYIRRQFHYINVAPTAFFGSPD